MANQTTGLFETRVIPGAIAAAKNLAYTKTFIGAPYWGYDEKGQLGETSNLNVPKVVDADAVDIGGGSLQPSDTTHDTRQIKIDKHPSVSFTIQSWDQARTPEQLREKFIQPKLEALMRKINGAIAALATPTNFSVNTTIVGGADTFTKAMLTQAWVTLGNLGVDVNTPGDLSFITSLTAYGNMMQSDEFKKEDVVGINAAELLNKRAIFDPYLNTIIKPDQQSPKVGGKTSGLYFHRYAFGGVAIDPPRLSDEDESVKEATIYPFPNAPDFPVQIQMQGSVLAQGIIVNLHAMFGVSVIRPEYGVPIVGV
jgi:hypothetical protein